MVLAIMVLMFFLFLMILPIAVIVKLPAELRKAGLIKKKQPKKEKPMNWLFLMICMLSCILLYILFVIGGLEQTITIH